MSDPNLLNPNEPRNRKIDETVHPKQIESFFYNKNDDKPLGNILEELNDTFNTSEFQNPFKNEKSSFDSQTRSKSMKTSAITVKTFSFSLLRLILTVIFLMFSLYCTAKILGGAGKVEYMDCIEHVCTKDNKFNYNKFSWLNMKKTNLQNCFMSTHNCKNQDLADDDDINISYMRVRGNGVDQAARGGRGQILINKE